ncbi:D-amino-acid transaminase [Candidatus Odyssella thessalonicensis]|uniref:D-amino-acid transaminase n=1 Tax=Candidatus Odyssella thessalonicensis TaxID=84647 RepID=UPI000225AEF7|nr:D-amino-acid transaminase [Candidatus Odyssella thessalonicensis]
MPRFAYVNGRYLPHQEATTHIEDRGYQFADGVYEVMVLVKGNLIDLDQHLDRLDYSLGQLRIPAPLSRLALIHICREVIRLNRLHDAMVYIQVSRGIAPRLHCFNPGLRPVVVVTAYHVNQRQLMLSKASGVRVITKPDSRWARPDIKSISLLPNILGKQEAAEKGCYEAILYQADGTVTECNATNVWIVRADGALQTHPLAQCILGGITRHRIINLAQANHIAVEEKAFSLVELKAAKEVFLSASVSGITPVIQIDETVINSGLPGEISLKLMNLYMDYTGG